MCARNATLSLEELHGALVAGEVALGRQKRLEGAEVDVVAFKGGKELLPAELVENLFHGCYGGLLS